MLGLHLLTAAVNGFTMDETGEPPADQPPIEEIATMARDYIASLPAGEFPNLVAVADHYAVYDPDKRFALLVDLFVNGLAQHVENQRRAPRRTTRRAPARRRNGP